MSLSNQEMETVLRCVDKALDLSAERDRLRNLLAALEAENKTLLARVAEMENCIEGACGIIANVGRGNWTEQHPEWQEAAIKWRDRYVITIHASMAQDRGAR